MAEGKPRILHVDDDEANRYAVTRSLVVAGFDVVEAACGIDALQKAQEKPDLVILDIRLPDIDGFEVCRRIKDNPRTAHIPVLHLSASLVTSEDKAQGLNGGAEGYLVRPVDPVELVATVNALLRAKATEEALRASEERLALAVEAGELGTFYCPMPLNSMIWNAKCKEHFWLEAEADINFEIFYSILHSNDREATRLAVERAVYHHEPYDVQYRTVAPDGRIRWVRAKGRAYYDPEGKPTRFDGITLDITAQKNAEAERERLFRSEQDALATAQRANQIKDDFLATLSHELRTPLNAILGWSQILRNGPTDKGDLVMGLDTIDRNARAQAQIIEDLLDMSRIISGKMKLEFQKTDLAMVVQAATDTVRPAADAKNIRLSAHVAVAIAQVNGDANRLQQVFWNLISNAVKFTPRNGSVQVLLQQADSQYQISVIDTGEGIGPEFLPYVFDRFRQADATTTRRYGGLGLGLSIVKQLVELHGGSVRVESGGPGKGSTFTVLLPVPVVQSEQIPESPKRAESTRQMSPAQSSACEHLQDVDILAVDDEPDGRALLERLLRDCGAAVRVAGSAADAYEQFVASPPDVLISDVGMPGEDGYSLMRRIRQLSREVGGNTPSVALTAYARPEDRVRAVRAGFNMHIVKPVDPNELIAMIASVVERAK